MIRNFNKWTYGFFVSAIGLLLNDSCFAQQPSNPIDSKVLTTFEGTINRIAVPIANQGSLAALSSTYTVAYYQLFKEQTAYPLSGAYNDKLV